MKILVLLKKIDLVVLNVSFNLHSKKTRAPFVHPLILGDNTKWKLVGKAAFYRGNNV